MIAEAIQTSKSIDYTAMKKGLLELNKSITFDDGCGYTIYMMREGQMRAGIHFNAKLVAVVERSIMQEYTVFDSVDKFEVPCSKDEFFASDKNDPNYFTQEMFVYKSNRPNEHAILNMLLGVEPSKTLTSSKGGDTMIVRVPTDITAQDGRTVPAGTIVVSTPMKIVELPSQVLHIGWRQVFERLMDAKIPGVTKETLGKKFSVDLSHPYNSDLQITMATKNLPTIG